MVDLENVEPGMEKLPHKSVKMQLTEGQGFFVLDCFPVFRA